MPEETILEQGFDLMGLGMGGVFSFLVILVVLMVIASKFFTTFAHWFPEEEEVVQVAPSVGGDDEIAVALAAVHAYNKG